MKRLVCVLIIPLLMALSCASAPSAVEQPVEPAPAPVQAEPAPAAPPAPAEEVFNPESVSQEVFDTTKTDLQKLIQDLNQIIKAQNYNKWVTYLSASYVKEISSPDYLAERTEELYRMTQSVESRMGRDPKRVKKVELKTARDYFINVVVPAHQNDRVEDIEFVSVDQVRAYTKNNKGDRLVLYNLEKSGDEWKITILENTDGE